MAKNPKPTLSELATRELVRGNTLDAILVALKPIIKQRGKVWPESRANLRAHIVWLSKRGWTVEWSADKSRAHIIPTPGFTGKRIFDHLRALIEVQADNVVDDIKEIDKQTKIDKTTKKALIDARIGQGKFRNQVKERWSGACAVTECKIDEVLRASHIKPWKESTNSERLDPENGLLLIANLDAAFDRGLISFTDDKEMLVSDRLSEVQRAQLGVPQKLREGPTQKQAEYLCFHRKLWGFQ